MHAPQARHNQTPTTSTYACLSNKPEPISHRSALLPHSKSDGVSARVGDTGRDMDGKYARARGTGLGNHLRSPPHEDAAYISRASPSLGSIPSSIYTCSDRHANTLDSSMFQNAAAAGPPHQPLPSAYMATTIYAHKENEIRTRSRSRSPNERWREDMVCSNTPRSRESDHLSSYEMALRMARIIDDPRPSISPTTSNREDGLGRYFSLGSAQERRDKYASINSNTNSRSQSSSPTTANQANVRRPPPHDDGKTTPDNVRRGSLDHIAHSVQDMGMRTRSTSRERTNTHHDTSQEHATLDWRVTRTPEADDHDHVPGPTKLHLSADALQYHHPSESHTAGLDTCSKSPHFAIRNPANGRMQASSHSSVYGALDRTGATANWIHAYSTPTPGISMNVRPYDDNQAWLSLNSVTSNMVAGSSPANLGHSNNHVAPVGQTPENHTPSVLRGASSSSGQVPGSGNRWADARQQPLSAMMTLALSARVHLNLGLSMPRGLAAVMIQVYLAIYLECAG
jgi:hypothetical protein